MAEEQEQRAPAQSGQAAPVAGSWDDPSGISDQRKAELAASQRAWDQDTEHGTRRGPFDGVELSGADVFWLAACALAGTGGNTSDAERKLRAAHDDDSVRFKLDLSALHLEGADLSLAHLEGADLSLAHLEGADLSLAHLEGANLSLARLEGAWLRAAHLEGAWLRAAHLEGAWLRAAHLEGRRMSVAELGRLRMWAPRFSELLPPADLRGAYFDPATTLNEMTLGNKEHGWVTLADVRWGGANLAVVNWAPITSLGDARLALSSRDEAGEPKDRVMRMRGYESAVRAHRQLAVALRGQGINEQADRFAYRAQVLQREVLRRQRRWGAYAGSALLDGLAGYGYMPARSLLVYLAMIVGFACAYYLLGPAAQLPLSPLEAVVFSVTSFHGRGFSPGANVTLANPLTVLAAIEAILGLLVEITFIATFTQRFFSR